MDTRLKLGFIIIIMFMGIFYVTDVKAESVWYQASSTPNDHDLRCIDPNINYQFPCSDTGLSANGVIHISEPMIISPAYHQVEELYISAISIWVHDIWQGSAEPNPYLVLYDASGSSFATSTTITNLAVGENKFEFSPNVYLDTYDLITRYTIFFNYPASSKQPIFYATREIWPTWETYPNTFDIEWCKTGQGNCSTYDYYTDEDVPSYNGLDLGLTIYIENESLEITYPVDQSIVSDYPLYVQGTCQVGGNALIYDGLNYASSTESYGTSFTCTDNYFSFPVNLTQGYWSVLASSTNPTSTDEISFFKLDQTSSVIIPDYSTSTWVNIQEFFATSTEPLDTCDLEIFGYAICPENLFNNLKQLRPYSYPFEIYSDMADYLLTESATSSTSVLDYTIDINTEYFSLNNNFLNANTLTELFDLDTWNELRYWFNIIIFLALGFYFVNLFRRFI